MKKTRLLFAILVASVCSFTQAWAQLVAPTMPQPQTLESGKTYYLYNVGKKSFLNVSQYGNTAILNANEAKALTITQIPEKEIYTIQQSENEYFVHTYYSNSVRTDYNALSYSESENENYCYWAINKTDNYYTFQRPSTHSQYVATEFLGFKNTETSDNLSYQSTENTQWQLFSAESGDRLLAETALYNALTRAQSYNYYLQHYEDLYNNRASQTPAILKEAALTLDNALNLTTKIVAPSWSNYPIALETNYNQKWELEYNNEGIRYSYNKNDDGIMESTTITARVKIDKEATLRYKYGLPDEWLLKVTVNGVEKQHILGFSGTPHPKAIQLTPGAYTIEWTYYNTNQTDYGNISLTEISIENTPLITVNILEPGSLGTEVLYQVNHVKDVRRLKVIGAINADDWAKINMMVNLYELDLSEAKSTAVPNNQFKEFQFLHKVSLPQNIKTIGTHSFYNSHVTDLVFPETLKEIFDEAFYSSSLNKAILPANMDTIAYGAFHNCKDLTHVVLPLNIKTITTECFYSCENLQVCVLPEGLQDIRRDAFLYCKKLNASIPSTVRSIGESAFSQSGIRRVVVPEKAYVSNDAFSGCNQLEYIEFPTTFYRYDNSNSIVSADNLKTIVLRSPTVVGGSHKDCINGTYTNEFKPILKVPNYLVNSYKLDEYWYNYSIEGFSTADIKDWYINANLVLNARDRFEGNPNLIINHTGSMKINGEQAMVINDLTTNFDFINYNYYSDQKRGQVFSKCDNISIAGNYKQRFYLQEEKWYCFALPVDIKVSEITNDAQCQFVIRYYDGAERAANGMGNSWKNYKAEDVIPAGTGFIMQSSQQTWFTFTALNNESKQYPVSYKEFAKALQAHPASQTANKGWNLVGNPYLTYYNIHKLNFTAPITVTEYDNYNRIKYVAYSVVDDDYALNPGEGFFVQCPEEVSNISFPLNGKQLTSEITDQNATRPIIGKPAIVASRQLIDIELQQNDLTDKTRVVFNEEANVNYETHCDAAKFMSESKISQIYTLDAEGTAYAINERPENDGIVKLGFHAATEGTYNFHLTRCAAETVFITDNETGTTTELTAGDYQFTAKAGTDNNRFTLSIKAKEVTGIENATFTESVVSTNNGLIINGNAAIYGADGRLVKMVQGQNKKVNLPAGIYVVKTNSKVAKVSINH